MKIGILQTGHMVPELEADHGDYAAMFHRLLDGEGFTFQTWNVVDMDFPNSANDADGWLITGSKHGAYEDHPFIPPLEELIREIVDADRPLIGVCFGHQIIAQALGGKVVKFDGGWAVGAHMYDFADGTRKLNAWHQDQVVELPDGAEVIASNPFCANAALLYPGKAYTIQPHPEFENPIIKGLAEHRGKGVVPDEQLEIAAQHLNDSIDNRGVGKQFAQFFKTGQLS